MVRGGYTSGRNCERCFNSTEFIHCDETWVRVVACVDIAREELCDVFCAETVTHCADFAGFCGMSVLLQVCIPGEKKGRHTKLGPDLAHYLLDNWDDVVGLMILEPFRKFKSWLAICWEGDFITGEHVGKNDGVSVCCEVIGDAGIIVDVSIPAVVGKEG